MSSARRTLFGFERRWAEAALDAIYPTSACETLPFGIAGLGIAAFLDDLLGRLPWISSVGLRASIWIVALAPLTVLHRVSTIVGLGKNERGLLIQLLLKSRFYAVRQLVLALKATGGLLYASAPPVRARIHERAQKGQPKLRLPVLALVGGNRES